MLWVMAERNQGHIHHHRRQKCDYFKGKTYFLLFALLVPVAVSDKKRKEMNREKLVITTLISRQQNQTITQIYKFINLELNLK